MSQSLTCEAAFAEIEDAALAATKQRKILDGASSLQRKQSMGGLEFTLQPRKAESPRSQDAAGTTKRGRGFGSFWTTMTSQPGRTHLSKLCRESTFSERIITPTRLHPPYTCSKLSGVLWKGSGLAPCLHPPLAERHALPFGCKAHDQEALSLGGGTRAKWKRRNTMQCCYFSVSDRRVSRQTEPAYDR